MLLLVERVGSTFGACDAHEGWAGWMEQGRGPASAV
jgi:hypothetical protein